MAENQLKEESKKFGLFLSSLSELGGKQIEKYLVTVDTTHFMEEQRAYYQGITDVIQMLGELDLTKKCKYGFVVKKDKKTVDRWHNYAATCFNAEKSRKISEKIEMYLLFYCSGFMFVRRYASTIANMVEI